MKYLILFFLLASNARGEQRLEYYFIDKEADYCIFLEPEVLKKFVKYTDTPTNLENFKCYLEITYYTDMKTIIKNHSYQPVDLFIELCYTQKASKRFCNKFENVFFNWKPTRI